MVAEPRSPKVVGPRRRIARFFLLGVIALGVLALGLAFLPISLPGLDRRLAKAWAEATGTELRFDRATWDIALRKLRVTGVEVLSPDRKRPVATFDSVEARWSWRWGAPPVRLKSLDATIASDLNVDIEEWRRVRAGPRIESLVELGRSLAALDSSQTTTTQTSPLRIGLQAGALRLNATGRDGLKPVRLATIEMPSLELAAGGADDGLLQLGGYLRIPSGPWPAVRGRASSRDDGTMVYSFWCRSFDSSQLKSLPLPFALSGNDWKAKAELRDRGEDGPYSLGISLGAGNVQLSNLASGLSPPGVSHCSVEAGLEFDPRTRDLRVESFDAKGFGSRLQGAGEAVLEGEFPYSLRGCEFVVSADALNLLQSLLPSGVEPVLVMDGRLEMSFDAAGDRTGLDLDLCEGRATADGVVAWPKGFRKALGPVEAEATLTSRTASLERVSVQVGASRFTASAGQATCGDSGWDGDVAVGGNWSADIQAERLLAFYLRDWFPVFDAWRLEGDLTGHGTVSGTWRRGERASRREGEPGSRLLPFLPLSLDLGSALSDIGIDGMLFVSNGLVYHPLLPGPIQGLSGGIRVSDTYAECTDLEGKMLGSSVVVSARVGGEESFWPHPDIDVRMAGSLDVSRVPEVLDADIFQADWFDVRKRALLARLQPRGEVRMQLAAEGPLLSPAELAITGRVTLKDMACDIDTPAVLGRLNLNELVLELESEHLRIDKVDGRIGPIRIQGNGMVRSDEAELKFTSSGALEDYRSTFPPLLADSDTLGGMAEVQGELTATLKPTGSTVPDTPIAFLLAATGAVPSVPSLRLDLAWLRENFDWDFAAAIAATDATYSHRAMPIEVSAIHGRFLVDREQFRTDGYVDAQWGESADGLTSGSIRWAPLSPRDVDPPVRIRFASRFPSFLVDEWIQPWGPNRKAPRDRSQAPPWAPIPPEEEFDLAKKDIYTKNLDIRGTISAEHVAYKRLRSKQTGGRLECRVYDNQPALLEVSDLKGEIFGGRVSTDITFALRPWYPAWYWRTDCKDLAFDQFVATVRDHGVSKANGLLSGHLAVGGVMGRKDTYTGSGDFVLRESRFLKVPIFSGLGKLLGIQTLEDVSFHQVDGAFAIGLGVVDLPRVALDGTMINLIASGKARLDGPLDLTVLYKLPSTLDSVPVVNLLPKAIETVAGKILKIHVTGTLDEPEMKYVPLSMDEVTFFSKE